MVLGPLHWKWNHTSDLVKFFDQSRYIHTDFIDNLKITFFTSLAAQWFSLPGVVLVAGEAGGIALRFPEHMRLGALTNPSRELRQEAEPPMRWAGLGWNPETFRCWEFA